MAKIVYNNCFGGFDLSKKAVERYFELMGLGLVVVKDHDYGWEHYERDNGDSFYARDLDRTDPVLVKVVEELGDAANGRFAQLTILEVPSGTRYRIDEYDGNESVILEKDQGWRVAP